MTENIIMQSPIATYH